MTRCPAWPAQNGCGPAFLPDFGCCGYDMFLFEFNDSPWLNWWFRQTLFEIMEVCNTKFRRFDKEVAREALAIAKANHLTTIVEMGAGHAPVTRALADLEGSEGITLTPCDLLPQQAVYTELKAGFPGKVQPRYDSVDLARVNEWPAGTLLVVASSFHHIPFGSRRQAIRSLTGSADRVAVFEPIRRSALSMGLTLTAIVPCLLLPLVLMNRPGGIRRVVTCWVVPVAPLMFLWDAMVSCLRCWPDATWNSVLAQEAGDRSPPRLVSRLHFQSVCW